MDGNTQIASDLHKAETKGEHFPCPKQTRL